MTNSKLSKNGKLIKWPDTYFVLSIMSLSVGFYPIPVLGILSNAMLAKKSRTEPALDKNRELKCG